jgi:uncharacterized protein YciW
MTPVVAKAQGVQPEIVATVSASGEVLAVKRTATAKRRAPKTGEATLQDPSETQLQPKAAKAKPKSKSKRSAAQPLNQ